MLQLSRFIFSMLVLFFSITSILSQPLSGILPKQGAFTEKNQVHLTWNEMVGASYTVQVAQNLTFTAGVQLSGTLTDETWITPTLTEGIWYWRVNAVVGAQTFTSEIRTFRIFQPNSIPGNTLWLAADSNVSLNGLGVSAWSDKGGNGHVFNQPSSANQPTVINSSTVLNNKKVIRFDGSSDFLNGGNILNIGTNSLTAFILAKGSGAYFAKFGSNTVPFNVYSCYNVGADQGFELAGTGFQAFTSPTSAAYQVLSLKANRLVANGNMFLNFNQLISTGLSGITSPSYNFTNTNPFLIGRYALTGIPYYLDGDIAEIIFYNVALSDADRELVQNHLNHKYAPPVDLGKDTTVADFCPITLAIPAGFTNPVWSTGETTASITVNRSGQYGLSATNLFGVVSSDTIQVDYPSDLVPSSTEICNGSSATWNTNLLSPNTFLWSNGATTPSINISAPGNYWVQVTDLSSCTLFSDTLNFTIDNYVATVSLGNDTTLCAGNPIGLKVGGAETISYLWANGATTPTIPAVLSGLYSVQTSNANGCLAFDTVHITISGTAPTTLFAQVNGCVGSSVNFLNQSVAAIGDPIASYNWDLGDGQTATNQNPSYVYVNPGVYAVQLTIFSSSGCGANFTRNVTVHSNPTANFQAIGVCTGAVTNFINSSSLGDTIFSTFSWNFGQPSLGLENLSTVANPSRTFANSGIFPISFSITDFYGCTDDTVIQFQMFESPVASYTVNEVCTGQTMSFINTSVYPANSVLSWNFGDGTSSSLTNPSKTYLGFGVRNVLLQITAPGGCVDGFSQNIVVHPFPNPAMDISGLCVGTYAQFANNSTINLGSVDSVWWVFNQNDTVVGDTAYFLIPNSTQQQAVVFARSDFGCESSFSRFFSSTQNLDANFSIGSQVVATNSPITFQNTSVGGQIFTWYFGDGMSSSLTSPSHTYNPVLNDSTVTVTLIVQTNSGCKDTIQQLINLRASRLDLEISNIFFQPNGNFAIVGVELQNKGSVEITNADLQMSSEKGVLFTEKWTGSLQPNQKQVYVFLSQPVLGASSDDEVQSFYCVEGKLSGSVVQEDNLTNNRFCKAIENNSTILITVFPNPAKDFVKLSIIVSEKSEISLNLVDSRGSEVVRVINNLTIEKGLYTYEMDSNRLESGVYFLRMLSNGEETIQRILIAH